MTRPVRVTCEEGESGEKDNADRIGVPEGEGEMDH